MLTTSNDKKKKEPTNDDQDLFDLVESAGSTPLIEEFKDELIKQGGDPKKIKILNG